jgi:hypothetical protein
VFELEDAQEPPRGHEPMEAALSVDDSDAPAPAPRRRSRGQLEVHLRQHDLRGIGQLPDGSPVRRRKQPLDPYHADEALSLHNGDLGRAPEAPAGERRSHFARAGSRRGARHLGNRLFPRRPRRAPALRDGDVFGHGSTLARPQDAPCPASASARWTPRIALFRTNADMLDIDLRPRSSRRARPCSIRRSRIS